MYSGLVVQIAILIGCYDCPSKADEPLRSRREWGGSSGREAREGTAVCVSITAAPAEGGISQETRWPVLYHPAFGNTLIFLSEGRP